MAADEPVMRIPPEARVVVDPTAGITREQAIAVPGLWAGLARTEPGMTSGWHHHGDYETSIYIVSGRLRMESGPGGTDVVDAGPGDFLHVPPGAVHRESNFFCFHIWSVIAPYFRFRFGRPLSLLG